MVKIRKANQGRRVLAKRARRVEALETRLLLAADWQNPLDPMDVDAAESAFAVTPIDALLVINELNDPVLADPTTGRLPALGPDDLAAPPFVDVDADGYVSPLDALLVINRLNELEGATSDGGETTVFAASDVIAGTTAALSEGVSEDTLINTVTNRAQTMPDVAADARGNMLMVWQSFHQDGSSWGIFGQRYTPDGAKSGDEFLVNSTTRGSQRNPAVALQADGSAMVVWQSLGQDGSGWGVYGQRYDASGNPVGGEVLINHTTLGTQANADVAAVSDGESDGYVVVWQGRGAGDHFGIFSNAFVGGRFEGEKLVNGYTRGAQGAPVVTGLPDGDAAIAWEGDGPGDHSGIFMTLLSQPGDEFLVNNQTSGVQKLPAISAGKSDLTVAWQSRHDIMTRSYQIGDSEGGDMLAPIGESISVSETVRGAQLGPSVSQLADGNFVVAWYGNGPGDHRGSFSRMFAADGEALSSEIRLNQTIPSGQVRPALAAVNNGYVALWQGRGDGDNRGIFGRFVDTELGGPFALAPIADQTVNEGDTVMVQAQLIDLDGMPDEPVFSILSGPAAAIIDEMTGAFAWTTVEGDGPGVYTFEIAATGEDPSNPAAGPFQATTTFQVTVNEVNAPPVLAPIGNQAALVGTPFSLMVTATDPDVPSQPLTFAATSAGGGSLPGWLNFNPATQLFSGTPAASDEGTDSITVTVTDSLGASDSETFDIVVTGNRGPVVVSPLVDQEVDEGQAFSYDIRSAFSDPDGDPLTYSSTTLPGWASLVNGVITGTPANADVGSQEVTIVAADPDNATASSTFTLTVLDVNGSAPSINDQLFRVAPDSPNGTVVGTIVAGSADPGDTLTFSITAGNDDGIFALDMDTGVLTVADAAQLATIASAALTVQVADGTFNDSATVTVLVTDEPILASYQLEARDKDGNILTAVSPGMQFDLVLITQDIRSSATGVFSAYADIVYESVLVMVDGAPDHSSTYGAATSAGLSEAGLINEAGGVDGTSFLLGAAFDVVTIPMSVASDLAVGTVISFGTNPTEDQTQHPTLLFGGTMPLAATQIEFGTLSLTVGMNGTFAAMSLSAGEDSPGASERNEVEWWTADPSEGPNAHLVPQIAPPSLPSQRDRDVAFAKPAADDVPWWNSPDHDLRFKVPR